MKAASLHARHAQGFLAGAFIGMLGGLAGLSGGGLRAAEVGEPFGGVKGQGFVLTQAISLLVLSGALLLRAGAIPVDRLVDHADVLVQWLVGSLAGAWWAAGAVPAWPRRQVERVAGGLLGLAGVLWLLAALQAGEPAGAPLAEPGLPRLLVGVVAGAGIGGALTVLGVAGSALLVPALVLLYGAEPAVAGSLSLLVCLPTLVAGFMRQARMPAFETLRREQALVAWTAAGGLLGAALGALLLEWLSAEALLAWPGLLLLGAALNLRWSAAPWRFASAPWRWRRAR